MNRSIAQFGVVDSVAHAAPNVLRELIQLSLDQPNLISLAGGLPADELFDTEGIEQATLSVLRSEATAHLQYGATEGIPGLRLSLAALSRARGMNAAESEILVTSGSQQAIDIVTRCIVSPGDGVLVERPTFITALQTFRAAQAHVVGIDNDEDGPRLSDIEAAVREAGAANRRIKLIYVVPSFSNPAGRVISHVRRAELLALAVRHDITILEDDPYGEIWFGKPPPPSIRALATGGAADHVIYTSSLSKIVSPGLRVGWMLMPPALMPSMRLIKSTADIHSSVLAQRIAQAYLQSDRLPLRQRLLREAYARKATALTQALRSALGTTLRFDEPTGGMFIWGRLAGGSSLALSRHALIRSGVSVVPGDAFFDVPEDGWLRLSFTQGSPSDLAEGAHRLSRAVADFQTLS